MCCIFAILVFLGPRVAGIIWWLAAPTRWLGNTGVSAFNNLLWPILGLIFVPWTTLMYVIVAPGGVTGFDWVWIALSLVADIASYSGSAYGNRNRLGYNR